MIDGERPKHARRLLPGLLATTLRNESDEQRDAAAFGDGTLVGRVAVGEPRQRERCLRLHLRETDECTSGGATTNSWLARLAMTGLQQQSIEMAWHSAALDGTQWDLLVQIAMIGRRLLLNIEPPKQANEQLDASRFLDHVLVVGAARSDARDGARRLELRVRLDERRDRRVGRSAVRIGALARLGAGLGRAE